MIMLSLSNNEAIKLRKYLGETCADQTLANIYNKLDAALKRPAVQRKYMYQDPPPNPFRWDADKED